MTDYERELLRMYATPMTVFEIAQELGQSPDVIRKHLKAALIRKPDGWHRFVSGYLLKLGKFAKMGALVLILSTLNTGDDIDARRSTKSRFWRHEIVK